MTVPVQNPISSHTGNGVTTAFNFGFLCLQSGDLSVAIDGVPVSTSQYAVSGLGQINGGTITFVSAPASGAAIVIRLDVKQERTTNYKSNGDLFARVINLDFDRIWLAIQSAYWATLRSLRLGDFDIDGAGAYRAGNNRIQDVADPLRDQDATNKRWVTVFGNGLFDTLRDYFEKALAGVIGGYGAFLQSGVFAVVRTFQAKMRDIVSIRDFEGDYDVAMTRALATLEQVRLPASVTTINVSLAQSQSILSRLHMLAAEGPIDLVLAPGIHETTGSGPIAEIGQNQNITLVGAEPISAIMQAVPAVSGVSKGWLVTIQIDSTEAVVGQALRISEMPGGIEYFQALPVRRPYDGELSVGFNRMGTITTSGQTCTLSTGNQNDNLVVGDLVHIAGQTRTVIGIDAAPAKTFTISSALDFNVSGLQWWRYSTPSPGTLFTSGRSNTVSSTSGGLAARANAGDVLIADGLMTQITAVTDDFTLTVNPPVNFPAGTPYTIMRAALLHEGTFPIVAVNGNLVTVRNRSFVRPPSAGVVPGAALKIIRTILKQSGTGPGFNLRQGGVLREMRNIALVGPGTSVSQVGVALNGTGKTYNQGVGVVFLGDNSAVIEWGIGVSMSSTCALFAWKQHINNNLADGVNASDGAFAYLREAVVGQNGGIGLFLSGGFARTSLIRLPGNGLQGIRQDVGSGAYGDSCYVWGSASHGVMGVNRCGIQFADGYSMCNGGNGVNEQNGGGGRFSRTLFACNALHNVSVIGGHEAEFSQVWVAGARPGQSGMVVSRGSAIAVDAAMTGNGASGAYALEGGKIHGFGMHSTKNGTNGARSDGKAEIFGNGGRIKGNVGADVSRLGGTVTTNDNPNGTYQQGAVYSDSVNILNDSVFSRFIGDATVSIDFWSSNSSSIAGTLRARAGTGGGSISIVTGGGITVLENTTLTGTTGTVGNVTVSVTTDGYLYVECRAGAQRNWNSLVKGAVNT